MVGASIGRTELSAAIGEREHIRAAKTAAMNELRRITGKDLPGPRDRIITGPDGLEYRLHSMR